MDKSSILKIKSTCFHLRENLTNDELVDLLKIGNKEAFSYLYLNYSKSLLGIIRPMVDSRECAEDVLQETFLKVFKSINTFDAQKGSLFTWMSRTARNSSIDLFRSQKRLKLNELVTFDELIEVVDAVAHNSYNPDIIGVLKLTELLPITQREVTKLIYLEGFTHSEAAKELGIPIGTLKTRLRTSISMLRKHFN